MDIQPGYTRVRRAPNIAYDNPMTNGDGMGTSDQYDGYNGAPDRYDWTVVGVQEKLSQQNNYNAVLTPYDQLLQPGHANPDAMRYELRRSHGLWKAICKAVPVTFTPSVCCVWTKTPSR